MSKRQREEDVDDILEQPKKKKRGKKKKARGLDDPRLLKEKEAEIQELFVERRKEHIPLRHDVSDLSLQSNHHLRPLWVFPEQHALVDEGCRILLETHSPVYKQAYDFVISIAEPVCRQELMHEYKLTSYTLYAAVSIGLEPERDIIRVLESLSKNHVPESVKRLIRDMTGSYGKVKLVLKDNQYFVEVSSRYPEVLEALLADPVIQKAKVSPVFPTYGLEEISFRDAMERLDDAGVVASGSGGSGSDQAAGGEGSSRRGKGKGEAAAVREKSLEAARADAEAELVQSATKLLDVLYSDRGDDEDEELKHMFKIDIWQVDEVKGRALYLNYPMLEEYDFRNDSANKTIDMDLKPGTTLRNYQERSLSRMFGSGRARSGIIVLPCGAGKTLVGITACCTVKKSALVMCTTSVAVEQWRAQFLLWSTATPDMITTFTSAEDDEPVANILICTYSMIRHQGVRSAHAERVIEEIRRREWGIVVLDEVHVVPAPENRNVFQVAAAHCKLGLTGTLVREDDKIEDLNFLVGRKLYEANWLDLERAGHIARVQCAEIWCNMAPDFYEQYLLNPQHMFRQLLQTINPTKFQHCQFLVKFHEARGDKIIIFSDNVKVLKYYALKLKMPMVHGKVDERERLRVFQNFKLNPVVKTICISKLGDDSIDLPDASVLIQISSHFGSRRQEAQRLGRILRPKGRASGGDPNAFFYTLVSKDTREMFFSAKRQQFLIDQGYSYKVVPHIPEAMADESLLLRSRAAQKALLKEVMAFQPFLDEDGSDDDPDEDDSDDDPDEDDSDDDPDEDDSDDDPDEDDPDDDPEARACFGKRRKCIQKARRQKKAARSKSARGSQSIKRYLSGKRV